MIRDEENQYRACIGVTVQLSKKDYISSPLCWDTNLHTFI